MHISINFRLKSDKYEGTVHYKQFPLCEILYRCFDVTTRSLTLFLLLFPLFFFFSPSLTLDWGIGERNRWKLIKKWTQMFNICTFPQCPYVRNIAEHYRDIYLLTARALSNHKISLWKAFVPKVRFVATKVLFKKEKNEKIYRIYLL